MRALRLQKNLRPPTGLLVYVLVVSACMASHGQNLTKRIQGPLDVDIAIPNSPTTTVRQDPTALEELAAHLKAVGQTPWVGFQGTGTISHSETGADPIPVTIYIFGNDRFRMDETTANGVWSIRTHGSTGEVMPPNSKAIFLPPETASVGSIHFQFLRAAGFPDASTSFIDKGMVSVNGHPLHRIATDVATVRSVISPDALVPLDLYFDPQTHLLIKSATIFRFRSAGLVPLPEVMTYSNYQNVDGLMLPFGFRETIDGEFQWSITLTQADLVSAPPSTFFTF